ELARDSTLPLREGRKIRRIFRGGVLRTPHRKIRVPRIFRLPLKGGAEYGATLRDWTVLGIETSCDETAAAVVRGHAPGPGTILSNIVFSQLDAHRPYGGVVPEIAARAHIEILDGIVDEALTTAGVALSDCDAI